MGTLAYAAFLADYRAELESCVRDSYIPKMRVNPPGVGLVKDNTCQSSKELRFFNMAGLAREHYGRHNGFVVCSRPDRIARTSSDLHRSLLRYLWRKRSCRYIESRCVPSTDSRGCCIGTPGLTACCNQSSDYEPELLLFVHTKESTHPTFSLCHPDPRTTRSWHNAVYDGNRFPRRPLLRASTGA